MHLIANTLLERETLELDQIKELIEQGYLSEDGKSEDGVGVAVEVGEPTIDTIGDVRVRIQGKTDEDSPAFGDLTKDIPGKSENDDENDSGNSNKGDGGSLV